MNFLLLKNINEKNNIYNFNIKLSIINKKKNILFKKYYETVSFEKEKIDDLENSENWDKMKKIGNPYELIYTTYNKKRKNDSISLYNPISRSYFKMWEIFYNFDLFKYFNIKDNFVFSHLAEGPGGFMEAALNYKKKFNNNSTDIFHGITLKPINDYIPDWNKIKKIFYNNENVFINYGNLYLIEDVKNYIENFKDKKAVLVTADGGFDYSNNFNGQEIDSCQIIFSECITAIHILDFKGSFVCKVFDLFSITMIQIIFIISCCFEEIYIYKPDTSRPANSEKYLVCLYYKNNLTEKTKLCLLNIIEEWNNKVLDKDNSVYFLNIKVENSFIQKLNEYNEKYMNEQIYYLNNTIDLSNNKIEKEQYYQIIQKQVKNAINWCLKYNIEINKNSIYYKKNIYEESKTTYIIPNNLKN